MQIPLYRIASNTKAFVSLSLAILVDEGKLDWDKPVRHYIPYFRLKDSYATEHVTPKDLLCHRTGLPAHARKNQKPPVSDQIKGTTPSQALEAFCGEYRHDAYGKFTVKLDEKGLYVEDEGHNHYLRHYHYDTFEIMESNDEA